MQSKLQIFQLNAQHILRDCVSSPFGSWTDQPERSHLRYSVPSTWAGASSGAATLFRMKVSTDTGFLFRPPAECDRCSSASTKSPCKQLVGNHKHPQASCISKGEVPNLFFKIVIGYPCYLSVHMSTRLLMDVPHMLVRKLLATPRELANERSALLMDRLNMLLQIGFLQFQVHQEWITK